MLRTNYIDTYQKTLRTLIAQHGEPAAMDLIVGGQFDNIGILELSLLKTLGLRPEHTVVDVGCGTGRLAAKLAPWLTGKYHGFDIIPELVQYAAKLVQRPDWEFGTTQGTNIPVADATADVVCFFSVFTHLEHDDMYRYLAESKRILKPGGTVVFSYLDFAVPSHWTIFECVLADRNPDRVLNQFVSKDAITAWTQHLGLNVARLWDGHERWIQLEKSFTYPDGRVAEGVVEFGQSVAVVTKG